MSGQTEPRQLLALREAAGALAKFQSVDEVAKIRDKAEALRCYFKQQKYGLDAQNDAAEIKICAERRGGELLAEMKANGTRQGQGGDKKSKSHDVTLKLSDIGIGKMQSSRWQAVAGLPEADYKSHIKAVRSADEELTTTGLLKAVRKKRRKRDNEDKHREALRSVQKSGRLWTITDEQTVKKCDAVITDPPYGILDEAWEPDRLEEFTREWAGRWSKASADLFLIFWSQRYLWDARRWFDESLDGYTFQQLLVWHYPNNKSPQSRAGFKQTWEPIYFYRRNGCDRVITVDGSEWGDGLNDFDCHVAAVPQSNFNEADQKQHPAQKPVSVMRWLVGAATRPGELVVDPFAGSGTTGIAATALGRKFHGIETNSEYRSIAEARLALYGR